MKYDVVIVGGGAAGSVLAGRLAANTHTSVLLLEAGPDYPDPANLPDEIKFGHTRFAEAPDSQHNWALRGIITEVLIVRLIHANTVCWCALLSVRQRCVLWRTVMAAFQAYARRGWSTVPCASFG
jgi:choline dehydrogenase-like flavoprotein